MMGQAEEKEVNRLLDERKKEPVPPSVKKEKPVQEVFPMEEIEFLKIENLSLKQGIAARRMRDLEIEMGVVEENIRKRLNLSDDAELNYDPKRKEIRVINKGVKNGTSEQSTD